MKKKILEWGYLSHTYTERNTVFIPKVAAGRKHWRSGMLILGLRVSSLSPSHGNTGVLKCASDWRKRWGRNQERAGWSQSVGLHEDKAKSSPLGGSSYEGHLTDPSPCCSQATVHMLMLPEHRLLRWRELVLSMVMWAAENWDPHQALALAHHLQQPLVE